MSTFRAKGGVRQNRAQFGTGTTVGKIRIMEESAENTELAQILAKSEWAGNKLTGNDETETEKKETNVKFVEILEKEEEQKKIQKSKLKKEQNQERGKRTFSKADTGYYQDENANEFVQPNNYELPPKGSYAAYVELVHGPNTGFRFGSRRQVSENDVDGPNMNQNMEQGWDRGFQKPRQRRQVDMPKKEIEEEPLIPVPKQELVALNPKLIVTTTGSKGSSKKVIKKGNVIVGRTFRLDLGINFDNDLDFEEEEEEEEEEIEVPQPKSTEDPSEQNQEEEDQGLTPEEEEELMEMRAAARAQLNSKKQRLAKLLKEAEDDYDYFSDNEGENEEEEKKEEEEEEEDIIDESNTIAYSTRYGFMRKTKNVYGQRNNGPTEDGQEPDFVPFKPEPVSYSRKVSLVPEDLEAAAEKMRRDAARNRSRELAKDEATKARILKQSGVEEAVSKGIRFQRAGEADEDGEIRFPLANRPRRSPSMEQEDGFIDPPGYGGPPQGYGGPPPGFRGPPPGFVPVNPPPGFIPTNPGFQGGPPPGFIPTNPPPGFQGGPPPGFVPVNPPPGFVNGGRYGPPPPGYMGGPPPPPPGGYRGGPPPPQPGYRGGPPAPGAPHVMGRRVQPAAPGELRRGRRQQPPPPGMY